MILKTVDGGWKAAFRCPDVSPKPDFRYNAPMPQNSFFKTPWLYRAAEGNKHLGRCAISFWKKLANSPGTGGGSY